MRRRLIVFPAVLSTLLMLPSPVWAGTLDQQQTDSDNVPPVVGVIEQAQVFTAGLTGQLDQVDLLLQRTVGILPPGGSGPGDDLTVEIWTVTAGVPASPVPGASATVLEADVPANTSTWVGVPISAPSTAGTQYAIVLSSPGSNGSCPEDCWLWLADDDGPYAAGVAYFSQDSGANWTAKTQDQAFRTYVAAPIPSSTPLASLADAATAPPSPASPLAALGFAAVLIGSLGVLAVANLGVMRRRG